VLSTSNIFFGGDGAGWVEGRVNNCKNQVLIHGALCAHLYCRPFFIILQAHCRKKTVLFHAIIRNFSALSAGGSRKKTRRGMG
jgi:hypothetical protein